MNTHDDLNTPVIAVVGLISTIIVVVVVVFLTVVFYRVEARQRLDNGADRPPAELARLTAQQQNRLAGYGWTDREKQIVHIPIGRAMKLVAEEIARNPRAVGSVVPSGEPESDVEKDDAKEESDEL